MPGASGKHASPRRSVTSPHWTELDAIARGLGTTGAALVAELIRERVETEQSHPTDRPTRTVRPRRK